VIPRELIDTAAIPGGGTLRLFRRGDDWTILLDDPIIGGDLMNSRQFGSEEALAELACTGLKPGARVLIGGLGMGFTLRKALQLLPPTAEVGVAELVPAVIGWARGPMAALHGGSLDDPRVTLRDGDVGDALAAGPWDAVLLDVDNGPDGLVRAENDRLYSAAGLEAARAALTPGGVLAIWSAAPDGRFVARLKRARFAVEEVAVRARGTKGPRHVIWLARR
jgi:spermidine synthase